jgi:serine/threonine-protein kinase
VLDRALARLLNKSGPVEAVEPVGGFNGNLVERDEHVSNVLRLRKAAFLALITWPFFAIVDWYIVEFVHPGRLWVYMTLRGIGLFLLLVAIALIHGRRTPSRLRVYVLDTIGCSTAAALITISTLEYEGITSPLALGVVIVIVCRSAVFSQNWRRSIFPVGLTAVSYPATLGVMAIYSPMIAAQFQSSRELAAFFLNLLFVFSAAGITIAGGHVVWALRRQVFESRSLGRYRLKSKIGVGGMGEVWAAHHAALKRDVAVKILRAEQNSSPLAVARFEREVRATAELNHPNTIRVFDYGTTDDGLWYYAMELLEGADLKALIESCGPMDPARAVKLMWQASKALAEAHARGITHRDVKPENLFVTQLGGGEGEFMKVLDFGLAKLAEADPAAALTQTGMAVGTPKYVSPEVVFGGPADARSDVYGLGAVLYYCVSGKPPFEFSDVRRNLIAHAREVPPLPSEKLGSQLPPALEALIMRCLDKDPAHRYDNGAALAYALEEVAAQLWSQPAGARELHTVYAETLIKVGEHRVDTTTAAYAPGPDAVYHQVHGWIDPAVHHGHGQDGPDDEADTERETRIVRRSAMP